jgi:tetratricopeptide (TPR) repeat protein
MKTSLCMIVKDEAQHLDECLASVHGLADELVIVDTGSRDDTRDIARARGAQVFDFPWCDDFSAARNESIGHASGDWILWMDADDRVLPDSRPRLAELIGGLGQDNAAYLMHVLCPAPDGGPMLDVVHARLFRNDARLRWQYAVHEQIVPSVLRAGGELRSTDIQIRHVGYAPARVPDKLERNLRIVELALSERPLDGYLLSCRGAVLVDLGRAAEALVSLNLCEAACQSGSSPPHVAALKGRAYAMEGDLACALEAVGVGLAAYPFDTVLLFSEAEVLNALGRYTEAEACLRALSLAGDRPSRFGCGDHTLVAVRVHHLLGDLLLHTGRPLEAMTEVRAIVERRPAFGFAWLTLGEALLAVHDDGAFDVLERRLGKSDEGEIARTVLRAARHRRDGKPREALDLIETALARRPTHVTLRKAKVAAVFDSGLRGAALTDAVRDALSSDPVCMRTWAIYRASRVGAASPPACQAGVGTSQHPRFGHTETFGCE